MTKEHNDANVIALGGRVVQEREAIEVVEIWLSSTFESELRTFAVMEHQPHAKKFINGTKLEKHLEDFFDENIIYLTIENGQERIGWFFQYWHLRKAEKSRISTRIGRSEQ